MDGGEPKSVAIEADGAPEGRANARAALAHVPARAVVELVEQAFEFGLVLLLLHFLRKSAIFHLEVSLGWGQGGQCLVECAAGSFERVRSSTWSWVWVWVGVKSPSVCGGVRSRVRVRRRSGREIRFGLMAVPGTHHFEVRIKMREERLAAVGLIQLLEHVLRRVCVCVGRWWWGAGGAYAVRMRSSPAARVPS